MPHNGPMQGQLAAACHLAITTCGGERYHPPTCHSERSVSEVEESTTLDKEPTQGKICNLGRFLDSVSLRSE